MIIVPYSWHDYISNHVSLRNQTPFFKCSLNALSVLQLTSPQRDEHFSSFNSLRIVYFNSRLCKETNVNSSGDVDFGWIFQLTSPQGDERILIVWSIVPENFNSHLRKETNYPIRQTFQKLTHFNSRLRKETNFYRVWLVQKRCNFNSRLREGTNDHLGRRTGRVYGHFNSRLRKETNKRLNLALTSAGYFNSRLRKETNI